MHKINFRLADKVMVPAVIPWPALAALGLDERRYRPYAGIKEQVTLADFEPDPTVIETPGPRRRPAHRGAPTTGHHEPVSPGHREHPVR